MGDWSHPPGRERERDHRTLLCQASLCSVTTRIWVTNGTPTIPGILNPLAAACDRGFVPDEARILSNPGVADSVDAAGEMFDTLLRGKLRRVVSK